MYDKYKINISKYPTISSIALSIYRMHFIKDYKIPILTGALYEFIAKGYTGGSVDVIKPYGKEVYHYDVNSLYPTSMKYCLFPPPVGGTIYYFIPRANDSLSSLTGNGASGIGML